DALARARDQRTLPVESQIHSARLLQPSRSMSQGAAGPPLWGETRMRARARGLLTGAASRAPSRAAAAASGVEGGVDHCVGAGVRDLFSLMAVDAHQVTPYPSSSLPSRVQASAPGDRP